MNRRTPRTSLVFYLLLNVIVSAATTLGVILVYDQVRRSQLPPLPTLQPLASPTQAGANTVTAPTSGPAANPLIVIDSIIGSTDPKLEYVLLKRLGDGDLNLAGWTLTNEHDLVYTFPALTLYKGGAVQVYTRSGTDTPTELYWNLNESVWQPGEWATLKDGKGQIQARFQVP